MQLRRLLLAFLLLIILAAFLYHHRYGVVARLRALANIKPSGRAVLDTGQAMPPFSLTNLGGQHVSVEAQPGHVLYLNVFATWCPDCAKETPALEQLRKVTAGMPVDIVGVDQQEEISTVSSFAQRYGLTYPIFLDGDNLSAGLLGVRYIPTSFLVDSHGIIRARISGALTLAQMEELVGVTLRGGTVVTKQGQSG